MATKWISAVEIIVPVFGGAWDGSTYLAKNLEPGRVTRLGAERYMMLWRNGKPMLHVVKGN